MKMAQMKVESPGKEYRRYWLPDLIIIILFLFISTGLCLLYPIDIDLARWFYHPLNAIKIWPYGELQPWKILNKADTALTILLAFIAFCLLCIGLFRQKKRIFRIYAAFIMLSLIIGPGLLVNGVFKDHWGRPRPVEIKQFGGSYDYRPPLLKGNGSGRSFPSGHASVAFDYLVFWFILRRRKRWALPAFLGGFGLGVAMSIARFTAGAHFLSDVIWSAGITYLVSLFLYYFVLKIPRLEDA